MLSSIISTNTQMQITEVLICTGVSLVLGIFIAAVYMFKSRYSKNFVVTLALLPALVQSVILLVNGNLGAGIAVMGAFSLVRFRSVPGSSREIAGIFFAMAIGLATGMGYVIYAIIFALIIGAALTLLTLLGFGSGRQTEKSLRIMLPEDVDYNGLFDDLFTQYTNSASLEKVHTANLGSLFEVQYAVSMKNPGEEKQLIDEIRKRNGNLKISMAKLSTAKDEL